MSLDVYLTSRGNPIQRQGTGVFIRDGGMTRELSAEEVAARFPGAEATEQEYETEEVYSANITHNLNEMAEAAGIYHALWRPEEIGITKAGQLVPLLEAGLKKLDADPGHFRQFNASNGWGTYDQFVPWVRRYYAACVDNPDADVSVSR